MADGVKFKPILIVGLAVEVKANRWLIAQGRDLVDAVGQEGEDFAGVEQMGGSGFELVLGSLPKLVLFLAVEEGDETPTAVVVNRGEGSGGPGDDLDGQGEIRFVVEHQDFPACVGIGGDRHGDPGGMVKQVADKGGDLLELG